MRLRSASNLILAVVIVFLVSSQAGLVHATPGQWSANSSVIYYNDGKVALGTSSPTARFEVRTDDVDSLRITRASDNKYFQISRPGGTGNAANISMYDGTTAKDVISFPTTASRLGNVGIGTYEAGAALHIAAETSNYQSLRIERQSTGRYLAVKRPGGTGDSATVAVWDGTNLKDVMFFPTNSTYSGNVGIGTGAPTAKLSVDGTVLAKEVIVSTLAAYWPDYVFADNYQLRDLASLEAYIKQNKHLPGIPAASAMGEQGISLGEMQKKQMEKIEELTLYVIEQNKRIESLEKQLAELK
jgi:hypothetical protein